MKNLHKLVLGLMVGAMAISFSAFTNAHSRLSSTNRYYNTVGTLNDTNPADFVYIDGAEDDCTHSTTKECSAEWTTTNMPTSGQTPTQAGSPAIVSGSGSLGAYSGD
jgi:hypothetical protein